jgi:hypothetical protein
MRRKPPKAFWFETLEFALVHLLPTLLQGPMSPRRRAVALMTRLNVDRWTVRWADRLRRHHDVDSIWLRVLGRRILLVASPHEVERVLAGAPDPYAADPPAKKKAMAHFQPDALTISRGDLWRRRRDFTEQVLDTKTQVPPAYDHAAEVVGEETALMMLRVGEGRRSELDWDTHHRAWARIARRIVLGDSAADDEDVSRLLSKLMRQANLVPRPRSRHLDTLENRLRHYVDLAEPGSLVARFAEAPHAPDVAPAGQLQHWLFAIQDTLATHVFRVLALLATHPCQRDAAVAELRAVRTAEGEIPAAEYLRLKYLRGCLLEAMRLWPTTPQLVRETTREVQWNDEVLPPGTQVLIYPAFNHRDAARLTFADRFTPEAWTTGHAAGSWAFNMFSHGPQECPAQHIALFLGCVMLGNLLDGRQVDLLTPRLTEGDLPHMLDFHRIRFRVT